jgi:hypothetical protein
VPKSSKQFTEKRKKASVKSSTFMYEDGKAVSSWEIYEQVKASYHEWQALRTKDYIPPPRSKPSERPGWVYSPKEST